MSGASAQSRLRQMRLTFSPSCCPYPHSMYFITYAGTYDFIYQRFIIQHSAHRPPETPRESSSMDMGGSLVFSKSYQYIRMEHQHNYEAEIAAIEQSCTRKTADNHQLEAEVITAEQQLAALQGRIHALPLPEQVPDCQSLRNDVAHLIQQLSSLEKQLQAENQSISGSAVTQASQISTAKQVSTHLQDQTKVPFFISRVELDVVSDEVTKSKRANEGLQGDLEKEESQIAALTKASEHLDQQLSKMAVLQQETEGSITSLDSKQKEEEREWLLELQALESELAGLTLEVDQEKQKQQEKAAVLKKQNQSASAVLSEKKVQSALLAEQSNRFKALLQAMIKEGASNTQKNATLLQLEQETQGKESVLEGLKRNAERLRDQVIREEKRIREEQQRASKQRNYKELTSKARAEHDILAKDRERQQNILDSTIRTKTTYLPRENLLLLQRELERHPNPSSTSLDAKTTQCDKLQRTSKQLGEGIRRLKTLSFQAESKEEKVLNEIRQKGNQLASNQFELQKEATEAAFKLNQYIKKFPNHDQEKEQKKKTSMRLKKTESIYSEIPTHQPAKERKGKKEEHQQFIILDDQMPDPVESLASQNFKKTKWYKRRSSDDLEMPDIPLYQNRYFQAAVLLFVLLFLAVFNF